jgi:hypothetical protein
VISAGENGFGVEVRQDPPGWNVAIVDPEGRTVAERSCDHAAEARTYASTVRQHIYWLSADVFRAYYRI